MPLEVSAAGPMYSRPSDLNRETARTALAGNFPIVEGTENLVVIAGVVAGAAAGTLLLYVAWRLFLRDWAQRRRAAAGEAAARVQPAGSFDDADPDADSEPLDGAGGDGDGDGDGTDGGGR